MAKKQETKSKAGAPATKPAAGIGPAAFRVQRVTHGGASGLLQNVRLAWVKVKEPVVDRANPTKASYSVTALIPEHEFKALLAQVQEAVKQAMPLSKKITDKNERIEAFKQAFATGEKKSLFKIGSEQTDKTGKVYAGFDGCYTIQLKQTLKKDGDAWAANVPLTLKDKRGVEIPQALADREFYSGCYAHAAVTFATYDFLGQKGVTVYLNGLMKAGDAERLGASNPFADVLPAGGDVPAGSMDDSDLPF